jgi:uracil-DNA glycosylase family protein
MALPASRAHTAFPLREDRERPLRWFRAGASRECAPDDVRKATVSTSAEQGAERFVPSRGGLRAMRRAAAGCRGCELWKPATQTVFGEGPGHAELMLVGEQPGDREDISGHPFVGPAGRELDSGLEMAGIDRNAVYLTNAVKHFRWKPRGKRRLHETPSRSHVVACRPWLRAEVERVDPRVLVLMGALAAQSLLGPDFSVMRGRGRVEAPPDGLPVVVATVHPSSILRGPDEERRVRLADFAADLHVAADLSATATATIPPGSRASVRDIGSR